LNAPCISALSGAKNCMTERNEEEMRGEGKERQRVRKKEEGREHTETVANP
jgi:hypothetical protein